MFAKLAPQSAYRPLGPLLHPALRSSDSGDCPTYRAVPIFINQYS
ncbi:MAG: hypothetical protein AAFZ15_06030 [Bacteroidota bacterium]